MLYFQALEQIEKTQGQAFNVGGGMENSMSIRELLATLSKTLSVGLQPQYLEPRLHDQKVFIADTAKLNNLIGWKPRVSKEEGINDMITWLGEQR